ncbi:glycosyltransferase [Megasphaera sp.]|uniref:glycosyltransferase n=1 Tax=Megasphaera sp. TaxID=2023260 RepID=UPI0025883B38|nr:glycosyltransferase [Megasphaera sp.]
MNHSLAGVIILYNPDESVFENVKSYAPFLQILYVIDNSSKINGPLITKIKEAFSVQYIPHHDNLGISYSLNEALQLAEGKYKWLLTMDQDSKFYENSFAEYIAHLNDIPENVYGICPTHECPENIGNDKLPGDFTVVERGITSGNIIRVDTALKCGGFDENLFIDEVDFEFCYRCNNRGYKLLKYSPNILLHNLGHPIYSKFLGRKFKSLNENYLRQYYVFRNKLYIADKYPEKRLAYYVDLFKWTVKILLAEPDKWRKLQYACLGCSDFKKERFGRFEEKK